MSRETALSSETAAGPDSPPEAAGAMLAARSFYWSLRRELWGNRSIYLAPLGVAALILLGSLFGAHRLPSKVRAAVALDAVPNDLLAQPYLMASLLLMLVTFLVSVFYSLDALQAERRDRSILLWKSLPVSDAVTVLAKASVPMVILPLLTVALSLLTHLAMFAVGSAVLAASGESVGVLAAHVDLTALTLSMLYHMVTIHALWHAPIYAWLLLVSAWSNRVPWLWATLPLAAIAILERYALGSSAFVDLLAHRMGLGAQDAELMTSGMAMDPLSHVSPGRFLSSPGLWVGLVVAAVFLAAAVRLRRVRGPV